jgi:hypothetical protein
MISPTASRLERYVPEASVYLVRAIPQNCDERRCSCRCSSPQRNSKANAVRLDSPLAMATLPQVR